MQPTLSNIGRSIMTVLCMVRGAVSVGCIPKNPVSWPQNMVLVRPWPQEIELPAEADGMRRCYYYFGVAKKPVRTEH